MLPFSRELKSTKRRRAILPTITWADSSIRIIDQRKLPLNISFLECRNIKDLRKAIQSLAVRGAPALGIAAAFGVLLGAKQIRTNDRKIFDKKIQKIFHLIKTSRPTAINLFNALSRMQSVLTENKNVSVSKIKKIFKAQALEIFQEEQQNSFQLGFYGNTLIKNKQRILTICNAGSLATVGYGTALAPIYVANDKKKKVHVYACETRPLLQGARLTTWELWRAKIDVTLICDHAAAALMRQKKIDMVFVGADRIALNGDTANKIGTYNLAILSRYHHIPFYVVAPSSTFDPNIRIGKHIPIELRDHKEITSFSSRLIAPKGIKVHNPAFDVTPYSLISAIITEKGILTPPFKKHIAEKMLS